MEKLLWLFIAFVFAWLGVIALATNFAVAWPIGFLVTIYWLVGAVLFLLDIFLLSISIGKNEERIEKLELSMFLPKSTFRSLFCWYFLVLIGLVWLIDRAEKIGGVE